MGSRPHEFSAVSLGATLATFVLALTWASAASLPWQLQLPWLLAGVGAVALSCMHLIPSLRRHMAWRCTWSEFISWGVPFLLLVAWMLCQTWNATHETDPLSIYSLRVREHISWLPGSVSSPATLGSVGWLCLGGLIFMLARCGVATSRLATHSTLVILVLGMCGFALQCILQRLTPKPFPIFERSGPFVNENQFAACMNLFVPMAVALAVDFRRRANVSGQLSHPGPLFLLSAGFMVTSIFLSNSRAGMLIAGASLATLGMLEWRRWRSDRNIGEAASSIWPVVTALFVLVAVGVGSSWNSFVREAASLKNLPEEFHFRAKMTRATWDMFRQNWASGTGAGTFAIAFPYYQPADLRGRFRHAHCEPVQALAELGLPGGIALACTLLGTVRTRRAKNSDHFETAGPPGITVGSALRVSLGGVVLHSCIDFPFREPSIALAVCLLLGLAGQKHFSDRLDREWMART